MRMSAPIACRPFTCWSTGRKPMAQPPGRETRARPQRASSGPRTSTEARMVFTRSYGAVGSEILVALRCTALAERSTSTPIRASSRAMVETSMSRGTLESASGSSVSSAAHMIGSAAFFAPEMATSPSSGRPPLILSLSTRAPLLGRERAHGKRVNFLPHALAERGVDELVTLHAAAAGERARDHEGLEMRSVAEHLHVLAGEPGLDSRLHAFGCHHVSA